MFKRGSRLDVADREGSEFHCAGPETDKYLLANRLCSRLGYIDYFLCLQQTDRWGPLRPLSPLSPRNRHTVYQGLCSLQYEINHREGKERLVTAHLMIDDK